MQSHGWDAYRFSSWLHWILKYEGISNTVFSHKCILQIKNWVCYHLNDSLMVTKLDNDRVQIRTRVWSQLSRYLKIPTCFKLLLYCVMLRCSQQIHFSVLPIHSQWTLPWESFLSEIMLRVALFINIITAVPDPRQVLWAQLHNSLSSILSFI